MSAGSGQQTGTVKCFLACALVSMAAIQYGIDSGLIGSFQAMVGFLQVYGYPDPSSPIQWNISALRQQMISSLVTLGSFISSGAVGPMAAYWGRKASLWFACALCAVSNLIMMLTTSIGGLYAGRFINGIAIGLFYTVSQLYLQECAPAKYRGLVVSILQTWTAVGSLIGTIVDNATAGIEDRNSYIIPLGTVYIVPVILVVGLFFVPESPRWLIERGKEDEKAYGSLLWLRLSAQEAEQEFKEIKDAVDAEVRLSNGLAAWDMFANPIDRRRTVLSVCALTTQAASGAMYIIAFGTYFFAMANIGNPFMNSCIVQAVGVFAMLVNNLVVTRWGSRRLFLITGLIVCGFSQLIMAAVYNKSPNTPSTGRMIVAMTIIYSAASNCFIAPYASVSGGELASQRLRSYTLGLATAIGFLGAWLTIFTAPYFINLDALNWGPKYGYIWAPSCFVSALWVWLYLPEVKDRTLEEIDEMFEIGLPARKFKNYSSATRVGTVQHDLRRSDEADVTAVETKS